MLIHPNPGAVVWPAAMIVWGPGFTTAGHRHHCVQLVMAMRGTLLIRGRSDDQWMRCGAALVQPDAAHEVDARDTTVLIGFVDSESELGAALSERLEGGISCISATQVARWRAALGKMPTEARVERWVRTELLHRRRPVRIHPGVSLVLKHLREKLGISDRGRFRSRPLCSNRRLRPSSSSTCTVIYVIDRLRVVAPNGLPRTKCSRSM